MAGDQHRNATPGDTKPDILDTLAVLRWIKRRFGVDPDYETILERGYRSLVGRGAVVADVGGSKGRHAVPLLDCIGPDGRLYVFEPLPADFKALKKAFRRDNRVIVENVALSDRAGREPFVFAEGDEAESGLRRRRYNRPDRVRPREIQVDVDTLDNRLGDLDRLDYIKIDIEGGEIDCLKGGALVIRRCRPLISVEYGAESYEAYGNEKRTLFDLARSFGYVLMDLFGNPIETPELWMEVCDRAYWDYWLVPAERLADVTQALGTRDGKVL